MDVRWVRPREGLVAVFSSFSIVLFDRRSIIVKAFTRGLSAVVVSVGLLGVVGCGPENEAEGVKLGKAAGDPGAANPNATKVEAKPVPNSQVEAYKQTQQSNSNSKVPGAKKQ
jgi:hypothetical protein